MSIFINYRSPAALSGFSNLKGKNSTPSLSIGFICKYKYEISSLFRQMRLILHNLHVSLYIPRGEDTVQLSSAASFHLHSQSAIVLSSADRPHLQTLHLLHAGVVPKLLLNLVDNLDVVAAIQQVVQRLLCDGDSGVDGHD